MANLAQEKYAEQIEKISGCLRVAPPEAEEWEGCYKRLRALKGLWNNVSWDIIEAESGEEWIKDVRKNEKFKEYYKLRMEADRLEALAK